MRIFRLGEGDELREVKDTDGEAERADARWHPVYLAVVVVTALVIAALWAFSRAYSS
jgi:hypothetical protein